MLKVITGVSRKKGTLQEDFVSYWLEVHAPLVRRLPGLKRYVVNIPRDPQGNPPFDGISESWWESLEAYKKALASKEGRLVGEDAERFTGRRQTIFVEEHTIL